jgi:hypothetical protein
MKILLEHIFFKKKFRKKLAENVLGAGSGSGRFRKSDLDPVKNRPDPQHCSKVSYSGIVSITTTKINLIRSTTNLMAIQLNHKRTPKSREAIPLIFFTTLHVSVEINLND